LLREYLRVSKDLSGREKSPTQQHDDHVRDADLHGFRLHDTPYREVGSASRYAKKARDEFARLVEDLQGGRFEADGLCLWEGSRGSRKVSEWAQLLDLLTDRGVLVWIHTHGRMYDPTNHRDRRTLLEDAVDAEYESGKSSDRLRRDAAARAAEGRPSGKLSWGYRSVYDNRTGKLVRREPDVESGRPDLVRELFARFVGGTALMRLVRDWAARGVVNGNGNPFTTVELRSILRNRVYIGERVHVPGKSTRWWQARDEVLITQGQWEPIVDRALFFQAQAILDDPARVTTRPGGARHLLSMIAVCDPCSSPLTVKTIRGERMYTCYYKGCTTVPKADLDEIGLRRIVDYLSTKAVHDGFQHVGEQMADALSAIDEQLAVERAEWANLKARVKARELSIDFAASVEPGIRERLTELERQREALTTPSELRGLLGTRDDVSARLAAVDDVARLRRVAQLVLSRPLAGELRVTRSPTRGHRVPVAERAVFRTDA
jgi:DNA invertase Pin-like site-specific DNA recombinase